MKKNSYKRTKISLGILLLLFLGSVLYNFVGPDDYRSNLQDIYDGKGEILKPPPHPPNNEYFLGTDRDGRDNILLIIDGIKYTIILIVVVSFLRVVIGAVFGIFVSIWVPALKAFIQAFLLPFRYVPVLLIGIFYMIGIAWMYNDISIIAKIEYQLIVLLMLGFPTIFFFTTDYIEEIKTKSFITSAILLGANRRHILTRHVMPHLKPQLPLLFVQEVIQTLQIMLGLAMFSIFIGGPHKEKIFNASQTKSITNELAGLTGQNFWWMKFAPYIALSSFIMLMIIFVLIIVIKNELVANLEGKNEVMIKTSSKNKQKQRKMKQPPNHNIGKDQNFILINNSAKDVS